MFSGSFPALVTPMLEDGRFDEATFRKFVDWQIENGSSGLVPMGTTGESPTLSHDEHKRVVEVCIEVAAKRVPVIAGAGSNNTSEAIDLAVHAEAAGADAVLVVTPYYNKPTQAGLFAHYSAVAEAISIPVFIYNVPGRSIVDITPETIGALAKAHSNIIGIKDATGDVARASEQRLTCGPDFVQLTGEDGSALGHSAHGGVGCISVTANVAPRLCADMQKACLSGDYVKAREIQDRLMPLHIAMFVEPSPAGAKYALAKLGMIENNQRLPLLPLTDATAAQVDAALRHAGLLN